MANKIALLDILKKSIQDLIQVSGGVDGECIIEDCDASQLLCSCIEAIFLHQQEEKSIMKMTKMMGINLASNPCDFSFWTFISEFIPKHMIEAIKKSASRRTAIGCCRVWVRMALNETTLISFLDTITREEKKLKRHYSMKSILLDRDLMLAVMGMLQSIMNFVFRLKTDTLLLNSWSGCNTLQLAQINISPAACPEGFARPVQPINEPEYNESNSLLVVRTVRTSSRSTTTTESNESQTSSPSTTTRQNHDQPLPTSSTTPVQVNDSEDLSLQTTQTESKSNHPSITATPNSSRDFIPSNSSVNPNKLMEERIQRQMEESLQKEIEEIQIRAQNDSPPLPENIFINVESTDEPIMDGSLEEPSPSSTQYRSIGGDNLDNRRLESSGSYKPPAISTMGSNSLVVQAELTWWGATDHEEEEKREMATPPHSPDLSETQSDLTRSDHQTGSSSYAKLWGSLAPDFNKQLETGTQYLQALDNGIHEEFQNGDDAAPQLTATQTNGDQNYQQDNSTITSGSRQNTVRELTEDNSSADDWQFLGDDLLNKRPSETARLLEVFPGVEVTSTKDGSNCMFSYCPSCSCKMSPTNMALDSYDGLLYCRDCHRNEESIIPRDVLNNWDFSLKPVSMETKNFLEELYCHPNLHLGKRNPALYDFVPVLSRLKTWRKMLSLLWYQISSCDATVSRQLKRRISPREYMLGSLQEVDLYSLEDLHLAKEGILEKDLTSIIDRICMPHVKSCQVCINQGEICDICRQGAGRRIYLYDLDTYRRCSTVTCMSIMHVNCIPAGQKSILCRSCKIHIEEDRPPRMGDYDEELPAF